MSKIERKLNSQELKIIFLSSIGGALEFYDFVIYIVFAPIISQVFFPKTDKFASLMGIYAIFAIGYFIRPLGGIIFSHFGDKYGRKKTFICSVMLMAVPTGLIGFLPTNYYAGTFATILLVILRLLQGLSIGGEIPGALSFTCEHIKSNSRGLACGIIFAFFNMGILIASLINLVLISLLSSEQLLLWGWRIPFIFGGILGIFSFYLRKMMTESPLFISMRGETNKIKIPLLETVYRYWPNLIRGILFTWLGAVVINLLYLYLPTYLTTILSYPASQVSLFNSINLIFYALLIVTINWLSDSVGRKLILFIGSFGFALLGYFLFAELSRQSTQHLIVVMGIISILSSCVTIYPCILAELFPTPIRYTGIAISYNIGFAVFGSVTPFVATYLIEATGNVLAPSYYLIISAVFCLIALIGFKSKHKSDLA